MFLAVGIMLSFHLWTVAHGETTVESHDHEVYRKIAKSRDEVRRFHLVVMARLTSFLQTFVNSYDLG